MRSSQKPPNTGTESLVDAGASALGLRISAEHRPGVLESFGRIAHQAQLLMEFPLDEAVELAPVFRHDRS